MPPTLRCPECEATLKPARIPEPGVKIRCPRCSKVFVTPEDDEALTEHPKGRKPALTPARRVAPDEDEDDLADDEPRPRKKKKKTSRKASSGSSKGLVVVLLLLLGILVLGGGGLGLYVLLVSSENKGTGNEDPLAYIPPGAGTVVGLDIAKVMADPSLKPLLESAQNGPGADTRMFNNIKTQTGLAYEELCARQIAVFPQGAALGAGTPQQMTVISQSSRPFSQKKLAAAVLESRKRSDKGKIFYEIREDQFRTLYMPSDRIFILSSLTPEQLAPILASNGNQLIGTPELLGPAGIVKDATFWTVAPLDAGAQGPLGLGAALGPQAGALQGIQNLAKNSRTLSVALKADPSQVSLSIGFHCQDTTRAENVRTSIAASWKELQPTLALLKLGLVGQAPKGGRMIGEVEKNLQFVTEGNAAYARSTASRQVFLEGVAELVAVGQKAQAGAMPGGMPPGGMPPGGMKPGGMPGGPAGRGPGK